MRKRFTACVLLAVLTCMTASVLSAQSTHVVTKAGTHVYTEENGLTILVRENHFAPVVTVRVFVRAGSMVEDEFLGAGISHLAEHLVSGGTTSKRTEAETEKLLDELGGNSNAATSLYWTNYRIDTTADRVADAIDLLGDWMNDAGITEKEFNREKQVVTRELERGNDNVERRIHQLARQNIYRVHPSRHPVIGYLSQLEDITRQDVIRYVRSRYVPNNMVFGVVGDVDAGKVHALIQKAFADYPRKALSDLVLPSEPKQVGFRPLIARKSGLHLTRMRIDFRTVKLAHEDMYPLDVLSFILSRGQSSRLVGELRDRKRLVSSITTWSHTPHFEEGTFAVYARMKPGMHDEVRSAVMDELKRVMRKSVTRKELWQAKTQKISTHVFANQTVGDQCDDMVHSFLSTSDPDYSETYVEKIQQVTANDIMRVARKYFREDSECFTVLEPEPKVSKQSSTNVSVPTETNPAVMFELDNGMKVLLKRNPSVPAVSLQAFFLGGLRAEVPAKSGLARLTMRMLVRGTKTKSAREIAAGFESMGGSIGATTGNNTCYVSASVLAADTTDAVKLLADVLRNANFPPTELEGLRRRTFLNIAGQKDNPGSVAMQFFRKSMYPKSVYGLDQLGRAKTVRALTRKDLLSFYDANVKPDSMVLAVYGDIEPEDVLKAVKAHFGNWRKGGIAPSAPTVDKPARACLVRSTKIDPRHQSAVVYVGYRGMKITDVADVDAMTVLETVMSGYGYPGGWLHSELRGKGLVYEVHAFNATWLDTGFVAAYARCQPNKVALATGIILKAFKRARRGEVTEEELRLAKRLIITSKLLRSQTNASQATEAAIDELYGRGFRFADTLQKRIEAVTVADLKRVAQKYFVHPVIAATTPTPEVTREIEKIMSVE